MRIPTAPIAALAALGLLAGCGPGMGGPEPGGAPAPPPPHSRPTADTGQMCDGFAGIACRKPGDICKHPAGQCRVADGAGTCAPRPQVCTKIYAPVCGCDGRTYGNACEADAAGAAVDHEGACAAG